MPNVAGEASTKRQMFVYALLVAVSGVLPTLLGFASLYYGVIAAALGVGFVWYSWRVLKVEDPPMKPAKALVGYSAIHLCAIVAVLRPEAIITRAGFESVSNENERIQPTEKQLKARRSRNIALALALMAFVVLVYVGSIVKLGPALFNRPL